MEKRLFIAVKYTPDDNFLRSFSSIKTQINSWATIKWVAEHQLHLTLCFLGDTAVSLIKPIEKVLNDLCLHHKTFEAKIIQLNTFSNQRQPRVLWMGLQPTDKFQQLHKVVTERIINEFNLVKKSMEVPVLEVNENFIPHLTLGRFHSTFDNKNINELITYHKNTVFGVWSIRQIILYESVLSSVGPTYKAIHISDLQP